MGLNELKTWRLIAAIGCAFSATVAVVNVFITRAYAPGEIFTRTPVIVADTITAIVFGYLIFRPGQRTLFIGICLVHGFVNILDGGNIVGCLLFIIGWSIALADGFFKSLPRAKLAIVLALAAAPLLGQYRFGLGVMLHSLLNIGFMALATVMLMFILKNQLSPLFPDETKKKKVHLDELGFDAQELEMLRLAMQNEKYSVIASRFDLSESKTKQKMLSIYQRLGVDDRMGFTVLCSTAELVFPTAK